VSTQESIDPREPLAALGLTDVDDVQGVSGGMDTHLWRVRVSSGIYALRLFRSDQQGQWAREVHIMREVRALDLPVPRIVAQGLWQERPAIVMDWYAGRPLLDEALAHPERITQLGTSMGRLQAKLHAVTLPREDWTDHETWLQRAGPGEAELHTRLRACRLRDGHALHLDFHPRNVLCDGFEARVILDWANAAAGDPRADVARTLSIFRYVPAPPTIPPDHFHAVRSGLERAWWRGYTEVADDLSDMLLFEIWAGFVFVRDMQQHVGKPGFWLEQADFDRVRDHVADLKRAAGMLPA